MKGVYFSKVSRWVFPRDALKAAVAELALDGVRTTEGLVLWLGHRNTGVATITHMVQLRGPGLMKTEYHLRLSSDLFNEVSDVALSLGKTLIGQAHSHPSEAGVNLSYSDISGGLQVPYYLSVVVPDLGLRPETEFADCGVHVFDPRKGYRRLSSRLVARSVSVSPSESIQRITMGG